MDDLDHPTTEIIQEKPKDKRAMIKEQCPNPKKCSSNRLYYYTMQLRGADEGSTVFYECQKCGYKFTVNN